jgi:hypothetical protein
VPKETEETQGFEVTIAGKRTLVRLDSFDGRDTKLCRDETGHAPQFWFQRQEEWDIDIIAMFVWLTRRKLKPALTYDDVLESISYDNFEVVGADGDDDDPEA